MAVKLQYTKGADGSRQLAKRCTVYDNLNHPHAATEEIDPNQESKHEHHDASPPPSGVETKAKAETARALEIHMRSALLAYHYLEKDAIVANLIHHYYPVQSELGDSDEIAFQNWTSFHTEVATLNEIQQHSLMVEWARAHADLGLQIIKMKKLKVLS
ncbi:hypothetical protein LTR97_006423 [Elasticomyces elasticus]|uniref:Uncharacterized protein n=1 Tax=Elasticomyces elasticus TaxID=574655 RepID=A0AAN7W4Q5_9PEZI|nr:hypothetical protein LTR97_006423 [Elasticomyces elasticus]